MKLYPYAIHSSYSEALPTRNFLLRLLTTVFSLGCMIGLSISMYSAHCKAIVEPLHEDIVSPLAFAWDSSGLEAQELDIPHYKINIDAFNAKRRNEIANDSRKLLSLALALRTELQTNPEGHPSADAVKKVKQIEKLAHDVKDAMRFSPESVF